MIEIQEIKLPNKKTVLLAVNTNYSTNIVDSIPEGFQPSKAGSTEFCTVYKQDMFDRPGIVAIALLAASALIPVIGHLAQLIFHI